MSAPRRVLRSELKYLVHQGAKDILLQRWGRYLTRAPFTNRHGVSPVLSQYYDSPKLDFYHEKVEGVGLRQKVRLRTYGFEMRAGQAAFLEIKIRHNDYLTKRRYRIPDFSERHLHPRNWEIEDPEARRAFHGLLNRYQLRRSAQVYYQREAYEGVVERDVRVTLDTCVVALHPGESLTRRLIDDRSRTLIPDTLAILEVKSTKGIPAWVHDGIVALELEQKAIPKYAAAVEALGLPSLRLAGEYA